MLKEKGSILSEAIFGFVLIAFVLTIFMDVNYKDKEINSQDSDSNLVQKAEEDAMPYRLEELNKGHLFRIVGLVFEGRYVYKQSTGRKAGVYNFGNSLTAGIKELEKRGYRIIDIHEITGEFEDSAITKDLLVFVEPLNKGG